MPITPEEKCHLYYMLTNLRLEVLRTFRESRATTQTYDSMRQRTALARSLQAQANALHSALKALDVRGIGEPLNLFPLSPT